MNDNDSSKHIKGTLGRSSRRPHQRTNTFGQCMLIWLPVKSLTMVLKMTSGKEYKEDRAKQEIRGFTWPLLHA